MHVASQNSAAPLNHYVAEVGESTSWLGTNISSMWVNVLGSGGRICNPPTMLRIMVMMTKSKVGMNDELDPNDYPLSAKGNWVGEEKLPKACLED